MSVSETPPPLIPPEDEDDLLILEDDEFACAEEARSQALEPPAWKVIIVDDEPDVHRATTLALNNFYFEGKPLTFYSAYSAEEGKHLITVVHPDAAVIILDVVMESQDAGLKVVEYIREELNNQQVRIILRTGQPGEAPEEAVIMNYDINDYKLKVELTRQKMLTSTIAALRSYRDIMTIEQQRLELSQTLQYLQQTQKELAEYTASLEARVAERTAALEAANQELQQIAAYDSLTQVANRRYCDDFLHEQWRKLGHQPLSLILIDVDYFKNYNDYYGHQAGDDCLRKIAQALSAVPIRATDLVARYGGEEFLMVMPGMPKERVALTANQILNQVRALAIPHAQSLIANHVTISLGVVTVFPGTTSLSSAIASADKALYQAKQDGRNRLQVADVVHGEQNERISGKM